MFVAKLNNGILLKNIILSIKDLLAFIKLSCNENGVHFTTFNGEQEVIVDFKIASYGFDYYNCEGREYVFGIKISSLVNLLGFFKSGDEIVNMYTDNQESKKLTFTIESKMGESTYIMKLDDNLPSYRINLDVTTYDSYFIMSSERFEEVVSSLKSAGCYIVKIDCEKENVTFTSWNESGDKIKIKTEKTSEYNVNANEYEKVEIEINLVHQQTISTCIYLRYLNKIKKASQLSKNVKIFVNQSCPLKIVYPIENFGDITYIIDPLYEGPDFDYDSNTEDDTDVDDNDGTNMV